MTEDVYPRSFPYRLLPETELLEAGLLDRPRCGLLEPALLKPGLVSLGFTLSGELSHELAMGAAARPLIVGGRAEEQRTAGAHGAVSYLNELI